VILGDSADTAADPSEPWESAAQAPEPGIVLPFTGAANATVQVISTVIATIAAITTTEVNLPNVRAWLTGLLDLAVSAPTIAMRVPPCPNSQDIHD